jgi:hypothetical protein
VVYVLIVVGIVYGFLALLNGRYINTDKAAFDQWKGEYVPIKNNIR